MDWVDRVGRRIRLRDLHIVIAVAESGSMSKAANRLAISHPVISKAISDLEGNLGVRLFDRNSQGVELTNYGQALLKCGLVVFDEMRQGLRQVEYLADPESGELRIGCPELIMVSLLPAIVDRFSRQHPRVRLHVSHASTGILQFQELRERNVELLIGRTSSLLADEDLAIEALFDEPFVAVVGARSQWARRKSIELADLLDQPWVLPPYESAPGALIADIFRSGNLRPPPASVVTLSVQFTTTLIATARYIGLLPSSVVQLNERRLGLKILDVKLPVRRLAASIITVKHRTLSPLAELFINCARHVAKQLTNAAARGATRVPDT